MVVMKEMKRGGAGNVIEYKDIKHLVICCPAYMVESCNEGFSINKKFESGHIVGAKVW